MSFKTTKRRHPYRREEDEKRVKERKRRRQSRHHTIGVPKVLGHKLHDGRLVGVVLGEAETAREHATLTIGERRWRENKKERTTTKGRHVSKV